MQVPANAKIVRYRDGTEHHVTWKGVHVNLAHQRHQRRALKLSPRQFRKFKRNDWA